MKPPAFEYHAATSLDETLTLLAEHGDDAKVLAGGQSLLPLLALRLARPEQLIDINRLSELGTVRNGDGLHVGALVRQRAIERSAEVATANPLLAGAARFIGHTAIRNRGTVGGSLAHGDPAAELPTVLVALDGEVEASSRRGTRRVAASDFYSGFLTTALAPDEVLTAIHFPVWPSGTGWSFQEFSRRSGDFAVAGAAVALRVDADIVVEARVAFSGVDQTPVRATDAESTVVGQEPSNALWAAAASDAVAALDPPSDLHGSGEYRRHLAGVLLRRALEQAHGRAKGGV